jgi:prepilin-type N-terminal cleavage/methylation domain-containing protein
MFLFTFNKKEKFGTNSQSGFSLIELMVTIAVMTLVTGAIMLKYSSFNGVVILRSQAYELALDIRTAQTYGVNTKGASDAFRGAYGIYFDKADPNQYVLFQDQNDNQKYDSGEAIGKTYTIDSRFEISDICTTKSDTQDCSGNQASVSFQRPDFDAKISSDKSATGNSQLDITVSVVGNSSLYRVVRVYSSGQISVK